MLHQAVRRGVPIIEINISDLCNTRIRWSSLRESPIAVEQIEELPSERFEQVLPRLIEEFLRPPSTESEREALLAYLGVPPKRWLERILARISNWRGVRKQLAASAKFYAGPYRKLMEKITRDETQPEPGSPTLLAEAFGWADAVAILFRKKFPLRLCLQFCRLSGGRVRRAVFNGVGPIGRRP